jgi:isopropylmalate/homocitrate/citramalate synthase
MLGVMTTDQKLAIATKLDELGVSGEGATRFHERRAAITAARGAV